MGKNRHHIDTSLDTSPKSMKFNFPKPFPVRRTKKKGKYNLLFPNSLRRTKLEGCLKNTDFGKHLNKYLKTEDPKYLFNAIKCDYRILQGVGCDAEEEYIKACDKNPDSYVKFVEIDPHTIVWETIRFWQEIIFLPGMWGKEEREKVKKYLKTIGSALIPSNPWNPGYSTEDGLTHVIPVKKGSHEMLIFQHYNKKYIHDFEKALKVFSDNIKRRYSSTVKSLVDRTSDPHLRSLALAKEAFSPDEAKRNDFIRIIEEILDEHIDLDEMKKFELSDVVKATASYMAWKHRKICKTCEKKKKGQKYEYETFLRLYKRAKAYYLRQK